jgi:hypothetical protein
MVPFDEPVTGIEQARSLWFLLTRLGWTAWENWDDYPVSDEDQPEP